MNNKEWQPITTIPEDTIVETKIDNDGEMRNIQNLRLHRKLFWFPDMSMYVYYIPTHWRPL